MVALRLWLDGDAAWRFRFAWPSGRVEHGLVVDNVKGKVNEGAQEKTRQRWAVELASRWRLVEVDVDIDVSAQ